MKGERNMQEHYPTTIRRDGPPLTAEEVKAQVQVIQKIMKAVMIEGRHFGTIPGTPKPTLYKPGSEKILTTFHIGVDPSGDSVTDLSTPDEIRYRVAVRGFGMATGALLGVGIGECSSNEEKYKWRKPVCEDEFNETPEDRRREVWKNVKGKIEKLKQVRTQPADVANTILKMAKKRAQIDMTLTVTAASDVFDQDLEDLPEGMAGETGNGKAPLKDPKKKEGGKAGTENGLESATINVADITFKDGSGAKGPWRKYTITDTEKNTYGTFSESLAVEAKKAKDSGAPANVTFKKGKYGNDLESLEVAVPEEKEPGGEG